MRAACATTIPCSSTITELSSTAPTPLCSLTERLRSFPEPASKDFYLIHHQSATNRDVVPADYGKAPAMKMEQVDDGLLNHVGNLLECMRTRKHPQTDIEYGHRSSSACLLGNIALRTKEHLEWDVANQKP